MRQTVPIDEGEAEAQVPEPVIVRQRLRDGFYRVAVLSGWGRRDALDALLDAALARWVDEEGWVVLTGSVGHAWDHLDDERHRTATFQVTGRA